MGTWASRVKLTLACHKGRKKGSYKVIHVSYKTCSISVCYLDIPNTRPPGLGAHGICVWRMWEFQVNLLRNLVFDALLPKICFEYPIPS